MNVDTRIVNKRALEGLILAGAFDTLHNNRAQLFESVELILDFAHKSQNFKINLSDSLFADADEIKLSEPKLADVKNWNKDIQLSKERTVVGFYISDHPLRRYELEYETFSTVHLGETEDFEIEGAVTACGVITSLKTKLDKSNRKMAFFNLDDFTGSCECIAFSKAFEEYEKYIREDEVVLVIGNLESSGDSVKMQISKIIPIKKANEELIESVKILIEKKSTDEKKFSLLKNIFIEHEGNIPLYIALSENGSKVDLYSIENFRVKVDSDFIQKVEKLFGEDSLVLKPKSSNLV